jgi:hypothetical protein
MDDLREHISTKGGGEESSQGYRMSGCWVSLIPALLIIGVVVLAVLGALSLWVVVPLLAALGAIWGYITLVKNAKPR